MALFLSIRTLPPILFTIDPVVGTRGDTVRMSGIALSHADIPTKIFINDTLVPEQDIINRGFFSIDFKINVDSGAKYIYLKQNNTTSKAKLLIVRSLENEFSFADKPTSQKPSASPLSNISFTYRNADTNTFIIDENTKKIVTHPIEEIQFEVPNTQIIQNVCSSTVLSNVMNIELPKHLWNIKDSTTVSLALPELFWFNYSSVANTSLKFDCKDTQFTFPLTLNSVTVASQDISSSYELNIIYQKNNSGSYLLPIQNRNQQRRIVLDSQYNVFLYNYFNSYVTYPEFDMSLTITPLIVKDIDSIRFEQNPEHILTPAYLNLSENETVLIDKLFRTSLQSTRAIIQAMRNNPSLQLQEIHSLVSTLYQELHTVSEESKDAYITQQHASTLQYSNTNTIHLLLMARILHRYGIITRTMLGAMIQKVRNQDNTFATVPIDASKDLLVWLEFYSKEYGWVAIQNEYRIQATASVEKNEAFDESFNGASLENSIQELIIPKNLLRLYVLEEYLWLEHNAQKAILPAQINFL